MTICRMTVDSRGPGDGRDDEGNVGEGGVDSAAGGWAAAAGGGGTTTGVGAAAAGGRSPSWQSRIQVYLGNGRVAS
jgi:hypothetical protein